MSWFKQLITLLSILLPWNSYMEELDGQVDYSFGIVLEFPRKYLVIYDLNQLENDESGPKLAIFEWRLKRYFLTKPDEIAPNIKLAIDRGLKNPSLDNLSKGNANITVVGTDEFRYLLATNKEAYQTAWDIMKKTVRSYDIFDKKIKFVSVNRNDQAWSYFYEAMKTKKVKSDDALIYLYRYSFVFVFRLNTPIADLTNSDYTSKCAVRDGFNNYFSVWIDCVGPEYMEIKANNYVSRMAKKQKKPFDSEINFPCYPVGARYYHGLSVISRDYEYCDHETYHSHRPLRYTLVGAYNKAECYKLIDNLVKSRYGCQNIPWCSLLDIPQNILSYIKDKILLNLVFPRLNIRNGTKISQAFFDAEIKRTCSPRSTSVPEIEFEACFYLTYLNYVYDYWKMNQHEFKSITNYFKWYQYFIFGPGEPPTTIPPEKTTTASPPSTEKSTKPPPKEEITTPPPKEEITTPPPKEEITTPPPKEITTPPPKEEITTPPPKEEITTPPPKEITTPPPKDEDDDLPPLEHQGSLNVSSIVGIVLGILVGLILLFIIASFLISKSKKDSKLYSTVGNENI